MYVWTATVSLLLLNQMASNQRVYLVYSDIERANTAARVRVQETEF